MVQSDNQHTSSDIILTCEGCLKNFSARMDEPTQFCGKCMGEPSHDDTAQCTELMERKRC